MPDFVPPSQSRLRVIRDGHAVVRDWRIPKPVVLIDTREQEPYPLAETHPNWIGSEERTVLQAGDYSVKGMENLLAGGYINRKLLPKNFVFPSMFSQANGSYKLVSWKESAPKGKQDETELPDE